MDNQVSYIKGNQRFDGGKQRRFPYTVKEQMPKFMKKEEYQLHMSTSFPNTKCVDCCKAYNDPHV